MSIKRIFHDPIHKEIVFDAGKPEELMIMELIDTVAFQTKKNKTTRSGIITFSWCRIE